MNPVWPLLCEAEQVKPAKQAPNLVNRSPFRTKGAYSPESLLTVALESTLLAGMKSQTELKYRFTQRGTALLGTKRSPQEIHKLLSQMYDARSAVVHTDKFVGEIAQKKEGKDTFGLSAKGFLLACEEVTREILVAYLHRIVARTTLSTVEKVNEALELHMIQNLNSPTE